jgi:two-component system sensor histidine kinase/response regulator
VQKMGGRIWLQSEVGQGSSFHFLVRYVPGQRVEEFREPIETELLQGVSVLAVDDNSTNRRILENMLGAWKMGSTLASSGAEALAVIGDRSESQTAFGLVILDSRMPDMDGFELALRLKEHPQVRESPVIMLTSSWAQGDAARSRELGIKAFLNKPIRRSDLLRAIKVALVRPDSEEPAHLTVPDASSLSNHGAPLRILLAEDNAVNQALAVRMLEKKGFEVTVAPTGRAVLEWLEAQSFDVILMDVQMPEMDGLEATRLIREREKTTAQHIPIVAMTAHAMVGDKERCLASGMDSYISKPLRSNELIGIIDALVSATPRPEQN